MAQVDFRPLIPQPENPEHGPKPALFSGPKIEPLSHPKPARFHVRFTCAQWTNLAFVICACLGALFSAAYLFKGAELFQEVAAWPRELFHGRAVPVSSAESANENVAGANPQPESVNQPIPTKNDSGDPFSPASKLLNPPQQALLRPNGRSTDGQPSSLLKQLGMSLPRGDDLSKVLIQGEPHQAPTAPSVTPDGSALPGATIVNVEAPNAPSVSQIHTAKTRVATPAKRTRIRSAGRSGRTRTAVRKPSFFQSLFGSEPKRSAKRPTGR
ncbi:MAG TPA: hypothetical protein VGM62_16715 [Chthoniobacterales bacterium]|jgi:hypothetical protein